MLQVAQGFVSSSEFAHLFAGLDTKGFVDQLYQNVLHRAPDAVGEQYWIGQLNGGEPKARVLLGFSDTLENRLNTSPATHDGWV
jgi:serralysin